MTEEKRSGPRYDDRNVVSIRVKHTPGTGDLSQHALFCFTRDVSAGGLSLSAHFPPAIGATLNISVAFSSPARTARNLTGRVAWVQRVPNGTQHVIGVDLSESDPESLNIWRRLLSERVASK